MSDALDQLYERMLVARCQVGDADAFADLVGRYQARLHYFLRRTLGSKRAERVDDLLQDVWLDVYRSLPRLADPAAFPAWVYRIARNRAYGELRREQRTVTIDTRVDCEAPDEPDEVFSADEARVVHECLDELTQEQREVLVLRFLEEMNYESIADVVGCGVGTVRSRLHYAKKALRAAIDRRQLR